LSADLPALWTQVILLELPGTSTNGYPGAGRARANPDSWLAAKEEIKPWRKKRRVIADGRHGRTGKDLSLPMNET